MAEIVVSKFEVSGLSGPALDILKAAVLYAKENRPARMHKMCVDVFCRLAGLPPTPVEHFRLLLGEACSALVIIEAVETSALNRDDSPYLSCQVFDRACMDGCDVMFEICNLTFDGGLLAALTHLQPSRQRTDSVVRREIKIFCPSVE